MIMSLIWVLWALGFYDPIIPMIRVQRKESSFNQTRNLQLEGILWSLPSSACIFCFQSSWTQTLKPLLEWKIKRPLLWHCSDWLSITLPNTMVFLLLWFGCLFVFLSSGFRVWVVVFWFMVVLTWVCVVLAWLCFVVNGSLRASKRALRPQGRIKTSQLLGRKFSFYKVFPC